jgi:chemotaxis methyl-accepting protein methylase
MKLNKIIPKFQPLYLLIKKVKYAWMARKFGKTSNAIFQTASTTFFNRHPDLFSVLQKISPDQSAQRILSFGSSTGEECQSLRLYFPQSKIVGAEINADSREQAIQSNSDRNIEFIDSVIELIHSKGPYDVVFALSVLCKNPEAEYLESIASIYPFHVYNDLIEKLDSAIKPGGYLVIRSSNYRFRDTSVFGKYQVIEDALLREPIIFPKFDKNSNRLRDYLDKEEIFKKMR